ncbi:MAG: hypothetical protein IIB71_08700 [Proteobacteria bacterium]|nr:hypothetical protein [Pseudomonadota bacterium]
MRKSVLISVLALSLYCASFAQAQDITACIVAQKVNGRGDFERAISLLYTTCIEEKNLFDHRDPGILQPPADHPQARGQAENPDRSPPHSS